MRETHGVKARRVAGWRAAALMPFRCAAVTARRLLSAVEGTSVIEFALIAPGLASMVLGISQVSEVLIGSSDMQAAARASVQYVLNGGTDLTTAQNVGLQAWSNKPANATLVASEYCTCHGVTAVCTQTCSDGDVPKQYISATATGTLGGTVYTINKTLTETARIR